MQRENIYNFERRRTQIDKISTTLGEEVCRETKYLLLWAKKYAERKKYLQLWAKKYAERQNICKFGRRSKQRDKISATLGEEVRGEKKYLQLLAKKYEERQNICNFGRRSKQRDKIPATLG